MQTVLLLTLSLFFIFDKHSFAAELSPLSLAEAIQIALANNPEIQMEKENVRIREAEELVERAQFDATLYGKGGRKRFVRSTTSLLETPVTAEIARDDIEWMLGWKKPFRWGGNYDLTVTALRTNSTFQTQNPTYTGDLSLSVTQPLLKGRGVRIRQAPLRLAKTDLAVSHQTFRSRATQIVHQIVSLYWDLVFAREHLKVQQSSLALAEKLLALNQTKVKLGILAPIEILVAEVSVASRMEGVIIAQKGARDVEEKLQSLLLREEAILPTDRPVEDEMPFDIHASIEQALQERPEIKAQKLRLQNYALSVITAEDQLRPSLDLVGVVGPSGVGSAFSDPFDQFSSGSLYRWEAGLLMTYPFGNRMATAAVAKAKAERHKAEIEKERLMNQVRLEVNEGGRRIQTDYQRILATRRALELAKKQLAAGEERFRLGLLSSHDLIQFQNDVAIAEGNALRAVIDYNKSLANLDAVTGVLLSRYPVEGIP